MIFFFGPLPAPVHGFSVINQHMVNRLSQIATVRIFNTATPVRDVGIVLNKFNSFVHRLSTFLAFAKALCSEPPEAVYLGLSGGLGQLGDTLFILAARLRRVRIYVHHHSFAYFDKVRLYNRLCIKCMGNANHIVLCDGMARQLEKRYCISAARTTVLSNAAFFTSRTHLGTPQVRMHHRFTIGFFGNITSAKGIFEFLDVVKSLNEQLIAVDAIIAGPVHKSIRDRFFIQIQKLSNVKYIGAIDRSDKDAFLRRIDLLLFPTKYRNEAEPLTILEALQSGVPVLSVERGCIATMISERGGKVIPDAENYVAAACTYIKNVVDGTLPLALLSAEAAGQFDWLRTRYSVQLEDLLTHIVMPASKSNRR